MLKKLYWLIRTKLFDNRVEKHYECPLCHWDSTNDDEMENATISDYKGGFYDWEGTAHWVCPRCGTYFITDESN